MTKRICLDAGHFAKRNRSPVVPEYYESEMNWKLHLLLKKYLEEYGFEVTQTRTDQKKDLEVYARGKKAKGSDLLLSVHSNAAYDESVDRPVVLMPLNGTGDELAKKLTDCIAKVMETNQAGQAKTKKGNNGDYYGVIRGAVAVGVPGLILEHSFHTNTRAAKWLLVDSNLDKMARAEADVIAAHYGVKKPESAPVENKPIAKSVKATAAAKSFAKSFAGTYKVTASWLNVRHGAGTTKKKMVAIPNGTKVKCYGYYSTFLGVKWLYIQFTYNGTQYTGFASSKYLKK